MLFEDPYRIPFNSLWHLSVDVGRILLPLAAFFSAWPSG